MAWPIGMGQNFRGVFDRGSRKIVLLTEGDGAIPEEVVDRRSNSLAARVSDGQLEELDEALALVEGALPAFDEGAYREGHLTPAFFGSRLKNFGVRALLDALARPMRPHRARRRPKRARSSRPRTRSPASSSRSRPTWTRSTATGWPSCGSAPAASSAA